VALGVPQVRSPFEDSTASAISASCAKDRRSRCVTPLSDREGGDLQLERNCLSRQVQIRFRKPPGGSGAGWNVQQLSEALEDCPQSGKVGKGIGDRKIRCPLIVLVTVMKADTRATSSAIRSLSNRYSFGVTSSDRQHCPASDNGPGGPTICEPGWMSSRLIGGCRPNVSGRRLAQSSKTFRR